MMSDQQRPPDQFTDAAGCPGCGAPLAIEKVVCIDCGYNRKLGKKLVTKKFGQMRNPEAMTSTEDAGEGGFRWGFDSGAIVSGLGMMAGGAIWFGLGLLAGRIFIFATILFFVGLFAFLKGIMGEEGIW